MSKISQREARKLRRRVEELEGVINAQRRTYSQDWFGGVNITSITYDSGQHAVPVAVRTARRLGHAVVVVGDDGGTLRFIALKHPDVIVP